MKSHHTIKIVREFRTVSNIFPENPYVLAAISGIIIHYNIIQYVNPFVCRALDRLSRLQYPEVM